MYTVSYTVIYVITWYVYIVLSVLKVCPGAPSAIKSLAPFTSKLHKKD